MLFSPVRPVKHQEEGKIESFCCVLLYEMKLQVSLLNTVWHMKWVAKPNAAKYATESFETDTIRTFDPF